VTDFGKPAILVTGMSGVGKSTALIGLARAGFAAVDTDYGPWIRMVDGEPLWVDHLIDELLTRERPMPLFVQGTVANQGIFYERFDAVVLLSAPTDVILDRLVRRKNNAFGKAADERRHIERDIAEVEPLLRQSATHEIDTSCSTEHVIERLIAIAAEVEAGLQRRPGDPD
jgi:dephospho-CoA kinase